jgi:hypothetical protein
MLSLEWRDNISPTEAFDGVSPVLSPVISAPQTSILTARDLGFSACRVMGGSYCSTSPRSKGSANRRDSITLIIRVNIRFTTEDERKFRAATAFVNNFKSQAPWRSATASKPTSETAGKLKGGGTKSCWCVPFGEFTNLSLI